MKASSQISKSRSFLQHYTNVLHIYCFLCSFLPCQKARKFAKWYELHFQKLVYML